MPRIGFTPTSRQALYTGMAPYLTPWSVRASAGISSSAARRTMAAIRLAPSSSENSVWLWRWTKLSGAFIGHVASLAWSGGLPRGAILTRPTPRRPFLSGPDLRSFRRLGQGLFERKGQD